MKYLLDIIIPVYNEGDNIIPTLESIYTNVSVNFNVLICYDFKNDNTLTSIKKSKFNHDKKIKFIKNNDAGPHAAVMTGIYSSSADFLLVLPADDDYNSKLIDRMTKIAITQHADIICPSRFIAGGSMKGAPLIKKIVVIFANLSLKYLAFMPVSDSTNGFRMFSRKVVKNIKIDSKIGFTYSIEYLVKAHRFRYSIKEIPAIWKERKFGKSRFRFYSWMLPYLRWYFYAFFTLILRIIK